MAANKMNVLHLHASDMCRFGVESKKFPQLTAGLTGPPLLPPTNATVTTNQRRTKCCTSVGQVWITYR